MVKKSSTSQNNKDQVFPVEHYSYSSFTKFANNPIMFKINNINGDIIDTATSVSAVLGKSIHKSLETYLNAKLTGSNDSEATKLALETGTEYLKNYSDGFINYTSSIDTRQKLDEKFAFSFFEYLKGFKMSNVKQILLVEKVLKHKIEIDGRHLPIALKGVPDFVYRDTKGKIRVEDHKTTGKFSDDQTIDAAKLLQAAFVYFLVFAELGEAPVDMTFRECKYSKNKDNSPQVREYTITYKDSPEIFELFYRMYDDVTNALLGKQVYVPNFNAMFDKEVAILAYIHRLDVEEDRAKAFKLAKVDNITDFLKKKIQQENSMKKYLETISTKFISGETLNYKDMTPQEKIKMKMAEHGFGLEFDSVINGNSVDLYRYDPSVGIKMSKIGSFTKDIEQVMGVSGIRVLAPIPNSSLVGFEVPKADRTFPTHAPKSDGFNVAMGVDVYGKDEHFDIRQAPHLLVAGATGAGKSVFLSSMIKQLKNVGNSQLWLFDPKMVELAEFSDIATVYESDTLAIAESIHYLVEVMNNRYTDMQKAKVRNIADMKGMPYIFVVIDEFGDLVTMQKTISAEVKKRNSIRMQLAKKINPNKDFAMETLEELESDIKEEINIKTDILLLAQKARAAGIHLIVTTQRPSVNIIDGDIKANFPTRIAFRTSSKIDSNVIIDQDGAESLLGKGDMLFKTADGIVRLQGFDL